MSIIAKFMSSVAEPQFMLARDLMAIAMADGQITPEEKEAISAICNLEGIDETKLKEALQSDCGRKNEGMPKTRKEKERYLRNIIKLIGADGYTSPQEIYLFQIIAGKMGLNQRNVMGLFMLTATRQHFEGDASAKIFSSFLQNCIDPKGKTENENRKNLRVIYDTIASNTEFGQDEETNKEILLQNLTHATEIFLENKILMKEFKDVGVDFSVMAKQEELRAFKRYTST